MVCLSSAAVASGNDTDRAVQRGFKSCNRDEHVVITELVDQVFPNHDRLSQESLQAGRI